MTFKEATLGTSGILPLELYFNPAGQAVAGAEGTVDNNYYSISRSYPNPDAPNAKPLGLAEVFSVTNGPSLRFIVDPESAPSLVDAPIDYVEDVMQQGFSIEAPNAQITGGGCGCGGH